MSNCFCGNPTLAEQCCLPLLKGTETASSCERLMRARYTAYALKDESFLLASWHPSTRPPDVPFDPLTQWFELKIIASHGGEPDTASEVEFIAKFKQQGKAYKMHERSQFIQEQGQWFYLDGAIM